MDTGFFWISKLAWFAVSPESVLFMLLLAAWIQLLRMSIKWARRLLTSVVGILIVLSAVPAGEWILFPLEDRFPVNPTLPQRVDGIIVLGGAEDPVRSAAWQQVEVNDSAERFLASIDLARRYPDARIVFTSGSGSLLDQKHRSSDVARMLYLQAGLDPTRVTFEERSRNTAENVAMSQAIVKPKPGDHWVLVTSAFHMPRSMGVFCKAGWPVAPYPVDNRALRGDLLRLGAGIVGNINGLSVGAKEWIGLAVYYLTGRTSALFPAGCNS